MIVCMKVVQIFFFFSINFTVLLPDSHIPLPEDRPLQGFIMLESIHSKLM